MTEAEPNNGLIGKRLQIKEGRTKRICKARSPGHTRPAAASWPGVRRANRPIHSPPDSKDSVQSALARAVCGRRW